MLEPKVAVRYLFVCKVPPRTWFGKKIITVRGSAQTYFQLDSDRVEGLFLFWLTNRNKIEKCDQCSQHKKGNPHVWSNYLKVHLIRTQLISHAASMLSISADLMSTATRASKTPTYLLIYSYIFLNKILTTILECLHFWEIFAVHTFERNFMFFCDILSITETGDHKKESERERQRQRRREKAKKRFWQHQEVTKGCSDCQKNNPFSFTASSRSREVVLHEKKTMQSTPKV